MVERNNGTTAVLICQVLTGDCSCLAQGSPDDHYSNRRGTNCSRALDAAMAWAKDFAGGRWQDKKPGATVTYTKLDGSTGRATVQRWIETTIIATDETTGQEVCFDHSDHQQWVPKKCG
jgi:hypothetical protein